MRQALRMVCFAKQEGRLFAASCLPIGDQRHTFTTHRDGERAKQLRAHMQAEKLSILAPSSNIMMILGPTVILLLMSAEEVHRTLVFDMSKGSYYAGGVLEGSRARHRRAALFLS